MSAGLVFLIDVDNTLLDNDRVIADLHAHLEASFGTTVAAAYWAHLEALRSELGYVDYLGALQRWRADFTPGSVGEQRLPAMARFLIDYPFAERLYPRALELVSRLSRIGTPVLLTDGDVVFQPHKVQRSGLWDAVDGRVLIYVHKEQMLAAVRQHYAARHYVLIDDKPRILAAVKLAWRETVSTVFPRQGRYAQDLGEVAAHAPADITVARIGELNDLDLHQLVTPQRRHADTAINQEPR